MERPYIKIAAQGETSPTQNAHEMKRYVADRPKLW